LTWNEGSVVLQSDEVITGRISVEPLHHLIVFEDDNARTVYPAHAIKSFYFYDADNNINRRFISIKDHHIVRNQHHLFEIILQGEVTFLRQQKSKTIRPSDALDFGYYIRYGEDIVHLRTFRKRIYPALLAKGGTTLKEFISANKISAINDQNSIRIIEFYNQLVKSEETIARY